MPAFLAALALASAVATIDERFLVFAEGVHVGAAQWSAQPSAYRESMHIETAQSEGRSRVEETLELVQDGDGWTWELRRHTGPVRRRESGRIDARHWSHASPSGTPVVAPLPVGVVLPTQRLDLVRRFVAGNTARTGFPYLDLERLRVVAVTLERCAQATTPCATWRTEAQPAAERWQFTHDGHLARVESSFAGLPLALDACVDDCARRVDRPLDTVERMVVDSPHRIPRLLARERLRYVLARADGEPVIAATTGEQAVARDGVRAVVTVCAQCGEATIESPATLAPFLAANAWVRSDDASIRRISRLAGRTDAPLATRMHRLEQQVRRRMRGGVDVLGYADAVQALRTGRGDCTEYAVLLAALARAQGIPTRVAVGMAYASRFTSHKHAFVPHAWVQAYDGTRWVSFDAAYEGFDSTHVALATGTGEPAPMFDAFVQLRQLRVERLGVVAP